MREAVAKERQHQAAVLEVMCGSTTPKGRVHLTCVSFACQGCFEDFTGCHGGSGAHSLGDSASG